MTVASQVKQTLSGLKGIQGTLRTYSVQTTDSETRGAFEDSLVVIG